MYRVRFDFIDIVLANTTTPKTMANFRILWEQQFLNQGSKKILFVAILDSQCNEECIGFNMMCVFFFPMKLR